MRLKKIPFTQRVELEQLLKRLKINPLT